MHGYSVLYLLPDDTLWAAGGCHAQPGNSVGIQVVLEQLYHHFMFNGRRLADLLSASPRGSNWCMPRRSVNSNCSCRMYQMVVVWVPGGGVCSIETVCCCLVHGDDERTVLLCCIKCM